MQEPKEQDWIDLGDGFIWDKFNLPLDEDITTDDYYSLDEVKVFVVERIKELNKIGYKIQPEQIIQYEIRDIKEITAGIKSLANNKYLFVVSKYAMRKRNERFLDTIIYHELCHILQLEHLFNTGMIAYVDNKLKTNTDSREYVIQMLSANTGHTPLWKSFVNKVNRTLLVNPPIADLLSAEDISDIFLESIYKQEDFDIDSWILDDFGYNKTKRKV